MRWNVGIAASALMWILSATAHAAIIDRIAIIVNGKPVKDSDIDKDIRITDFLNGDPLSTSQAERKKGAQRLIEQQFIRREVELGNYPRATAAEVDAFLKTIRQQRFASENKYRAALNKYSIADAELRTQLAWQITVLHFIDQRFRPAVLVSEADIDTYAKTHSLPRDQIQELLVGERVNQAFEAWLEGARKRARIEYKEPELQ